MTIHRSLVNINLRRAVVDDATDLSHFAAKCFRDTYGSDSMPEDMEAYLAESFSPEIQAAQITDRTSTVILAMSAGTLAGYVHLVVSDDGIELKRLYVDPAWKERPSTKSHGSNL